ncbi:MAG TPA: VOC family protein [Caulobacteraceae bacterium]|jgi:uncharacterized glyoxalase superfamily protein PhnB
MTQPSLTPYPTYLDARAALTFLEAAFGFETEVLVLGEADEVAHAEMRVGDGRIGIGAAWEGRIASPTALGGMSSSYVHVHVETDLDAHCARARAAGAAILREPATQPYGDRTYVAADPEGNVWSFGQTVDAAVRAAWDRPGGVARKSAA